MIDRTDYSRARKLETVESHGVQFFVQKAKPNYAAKAGVLILTLDGMAVAAYHKREGLEHTPQSAKAWFSEKFAHHFPTKAAQDVQIEFLKKRGGADI